MIDWLRLNADWLSDMSLAICGAVAVHYIIEISASLKKIYHNLGTIGRMIRDEIQD